MFFCRKKSHPGTIFEQVIYSWPLFSSIQVNSHPLVCLSLFLFQELLKHDCNLFKSLFSSKGGPPYYMQAMDFQLHLFQDEIAPSCLLIFGPFIGGPNFTPFQNVDPRGAEPTGRPVGSPAEANNVQSCAMEAVYRGRRDDEMRLVVWFYCNPYEYSWVVKEPRSILQNWVCMVCLEVSCYKNPTVSFPYGSMYVIWVFPKLVGFPNKLLVFLLKMTILKC